GREGRPICLSGPPPAQAQFPCVMDPADQCGGPRARPDLWPVHQRPRQGGRRDRPQGPRRSRSARARRLQVAGRQSQGGALSSPPCRERPMSSVMKQDASVERLESGILAEISTAADERALETVRVAALGKKGVISERMKELGSLDPEARRSTGAL